MKKVISFCFLTTKMGNNDQPLYGTIISRNTETWVVQKIEYV